MGLFVAHDDLQGRNFLMVSKSRLFQHSCIMDLKTGKESKVLEEAEGVPSSSSAATRLGSQEGRRTNVPRV